MKKTAAILIIAMLVLALAACNPPQTSETTTSAQQPTTASAGSETTTVMTEAPTTANQETSGAPATGATSSEASTTTTEAAGPVMYSSYAHMVSYDPARGQADFDYFNMLRGDDAVQYLVDHEGYRVEDARALVDDFADSEFVESNLNPQLRTIDLTAVEIKLMYYPDGTMVTGPEPIDSELIDLFDLYHVDSSYVLDIFFYYITVVDGQVTTVEQVYWP